MTAARAEIVIELAGPGDLEAAAELLAIQLREHHVRIARERIDTAVGELIREPRLGFVMLGRADGAIVGVAYVSHQWTLEYGGLTAWLEELYVLPEWRSRGVGRRLLRGVIDHATKIGCAAVDLEVEREHRRSEHLYERMGFRRYDRARWAKRLRRSPSPMNRGKVGVVRPRPNPGGDFN
jgi:GNAT superfamily N-acetyltransferase